MIKVTIILHSVLRDLFSESKEGRIVLELPEGTDIRTIMGKLHLPPSTASGVNGTIVRDSGVVLADGDELRFFRPGAGG